MDNYVHQMPGMLRIKNPMFKNNITLLDKITSRFESIAGIEYVTTNPLSGTFIVNYDADIIHPDRLLKLLKQDVYFGRPYIA